MASRKSLNSSFNTSGNAGKRVYVIAYDGYHLESGGVLTDNERNALDTTYELLTASGASVGKTSIQKILKLTKNSAGISYVVPRFDGPVFKKLQELQARIYGPLAITSTLQSSERKIYLWDVPLLCTSFKGFLVTCTGILADERAKLALMVKHMGGVFSGSMSDTTTHLIATECNPTADKYRLARKFKLPVVTPEWISMIYQSAQHGELIDANGLLDVYPVPLFANCVVTCSGVGNDERLKISKLIENHGGQFSGEMNRETCTHLLINTNTGQKFKKAKEWGTVHIVVIRWLSMCLDHGYRLPEAKFFPGNKTSTQGHDASNLTFGGSSLSVSSIAAVNSSLNSSMSSVIRRASSKTSLVSAIVNPLRMPSTKSFRRQSSQIVGPPDPVLDADLAKLRENSGRFLETCRLHFFEVPAKSFKTYKTLGHLGCCFIVESITQDPTHIVVPSNATINGHNLETLREAYASEIPIVTGEWLLKCVTLKDNLDPDAFIHPSVNASETEENVAPIKTHPSAAGAFTFAVPEVRKVSRRSSGFGIDTTKGSTLYNTTDELCFDQGEFSESTNNSVKDGLQSASTASNQNHDDDWSNSFYVPPNATSTQKNSSHSSIPLKNQMASPIQQNFGMDPLTEDPFKNLAIPPPQSTPILSNAAMPPSKNLSQRRSILKTSQLKQPAIPFASTPISAMSRSVRTLSPTPLKSAMSPINNVTSLTNEKPSASQASDTSTQPFFETRTFGLETLPTASQQELVIGEIERLGGLVIPISNVTEPIEVDFLLAPSLDFDADKYPNVYYRNLATVFWLQYCSDSAQEHAIKNHPCFKPFGMVPDRSILNGVVAAVSGSSMRIEKVLFGSLIEELGGIHQPAMCRANTDKLRRTTHVIALGPSPRLKDVRRWGNVHVVDGSWLVECIAKGRQVPEEDYPFDDVLFKHYAGRSDPVWIQNSRSGAPLRNILDETPEILRDTVGLPKSIFCPDDTPPNDESGAIESLFSHDNPSASPSSVTSSEAGINRLNLSAPMEEYISGNRPYRLKIFDNPMHVRPERCSDVVKIFTHDNDGESDVSVHGGGPDDSIQGDSFVAKQLRQMVRNCCNDTTEFEQFYLKNGPNADERDWHDVTIYRDAAYVNGPREIPIPPKLASPGLYERPFPSGPKTPKFLLGQFEENGNEASQRGAAPSVAPVIVDFSEAEAVDESGGGGAEAPVKAVEIVVVEASKSHESEPVRAEEPAPSEVPGPSTSPTPPPRTVRTSVHEDMSVEEFREQVAKVSSATRMLDMLTRNCRKSAPQESSESSSSDSSSEEEDPVKAAVAQYAEMAKRNDFEEDKNKKYTGPKPDYPFEMGWAKGISTQEIMPVDPNKVHENVDDHFFDPDSNDPEYRRPKRKMTRAAALMREPLQAKKNKDKRKRSDRRRHNSKAFVDEAKEWLKAGEQPSMSDKSVSGRSSVTTAQSSRSTVTNVVAAIEAENNSTPGEMASTSIAEVEDDDVVIVESVSKEPKDVQIAPVAPQLDLEASAGASEAPASSSKASPGEGEAAGEVDSFDLTWEVNLDTQTDVLPKSVMNMPTSSNDISVDTVRIDDLKVPPAVNIETNQATKQLPPLTIVPEEHSFNPGEAWNAASLDETPQILNEPRRTTLNETEVARNMSQRRRITEVESDFTTSPLAKKLKQSSTPPKPECSAVAPAKKERIIPERTTVVTRRAAKLMNVSVASSTTKSTNGDDTLTSLEASNAFVHKRFILSGVARERANIEQQILELKGTILQPKDFGIAQVVLCTEPTRTQKLLSAISAGKRICHTSYVIASARSGQWLDEEEYEFGNPKSYRRIRKQDMSELSQKIGNAGYRWRTSIDSTGRGAFYGWKVILFMPARRAESLAEVIKCGGGEAELSVCVNHRTLKTFTHVIIKDMEPPRGMLAILGKERVPFYSDNLISDYLLGEIPESALSKYHPCHMEFHC